MTAADMPSDRRRTLYRALAILGAAALLRLVWIAAIRRTGCLAINLDPISDMETFHRWALSIVAGDWLGTGDFHPFHPWQAAIAAREQWNLWYGHVFHQEPFYPYLIAGLYLIAPRVPLTVIVAQLLMGAAGCAFVYLAARRVAPEGAALAAGGLAAVYGPYLYYESLLLRDSFLIPLHAAILWVVLEARSRGGGRRARVWWLWAGLLIGVSCVTKASILAFFVLLLLLVALEGRGRPARARLAPLLLLVAGFAAALSPVLVRNAMVGAPLLQLTTRGPIEFINGNNPWHPGTGWFDGDDQRVSTYAREILRRADGRLLPAAIEVLRGWSGDPAGFLRLQLYKAGYFLAPFEMPNNASYAYFRENSAQLRYAALSFFWISPLALAGLVASWDRRRLFAPIYLFLASGALVTVAFYVIARFRAPLMPPILILAGFGLWSFVDGARAGRTARAALLGALILAGLWVNLYTDYPDRALVRPQDYLIATEAYRSRGDEGAALAEVERARGLFPSIGLFHRMAGLLYLDAGRRPEAREALLRALELNPGDDEARRALASIPAGPVP